MIFCILLRPNKTETKNDERRASETVRDYSRLAHIIRMSIGGPQPITRVYAKQFFFSFVFFFFFFSHLFRWSPTEKKSNGQSGTARSSVWRRQQQSSERAHSAKQTHTLTFNTMRAVRAYFWTNNLPSHDYSLFHYSRQCIASRIDANGWDSISIFRLLFYFRVVCFLSSSSSSSFCYARDAKTRRRINRPAFLK